MSFLEVKQKNKKNEKAKTIIRNYIYEKFALLLYIIFEISLGRLSNT